MSDAPAKPKRRWWVRLVRAALWSVLLVIILVSGGLWWVYWKRVALLNNALASAGPVQGQVRAFEVTRSGGIELHDLVFTDRATGAVVARLPSVSGQANLVKLPPDEISSMTIRNPEITITATMLDAWRKQAAANPTSAGGAPPIPFGTRFTKVDIENARVRFEQTDGSTAELTLNYKGKDVAVQPGGITTGPQELSIEEGAVKLKGGGEAPVTLQNLRVKGRVHEGIVDIADVELGQTALKLTPELLAMFGLNFSGAASTDATGAKPPPVPPPASGLVREVRIENAKVSDVSLSTSGFADKNVSGLSLPNIEAGGSYEAHGIEWHEGAMPVVTSQKAQLRDVKIETPDHSGYARFGSASLEMNTADKGAKWIVESLVLNKPDILWTPQLRMLLPLPNSGRKADATTDTKTPPTSATAAAPPSEPARPTVLLKQVSVTEASIAIADPGMMPFELHTKGTLMLANLLLDSKGLHSQSFQTLEVTEGRLVFPSAEGQPEKKPWLELPHGEMVVKPDDWNEHTRIAKLALDGLVVRMRDGNTPWVATEPATAKADQPQTENREPPTEKREPGTEDPWWKRINSDELTLNKGVADLVLNLPKPVDMRAQVDITTKRTDGGGGQHTVRIADFTARLPSLSPTPFPVAQANLIEGVVRLPEMWTQQRIDELHLTGASVDMNEALLKLFEREKQETASAAEPKTEPAGPPAPAEAKNPRSERRNQTPDSPWQVGHLSVQDSAVTVTNLVPGMPAVKFGVSFEVKDTPLLAEDLAKDVAPQRIELHNLKIPSPNGTARYVAEMDSIFVNFSLGGLMRKEIERVEIVSPTLFVGEDLFWYVDFYRKYAERGAHPAPKGPHVAANDDRLESKLASDVADAEPSTSEASWSVKRLQVHSGKLVLAPKGIPLKGFHTPFPFHIDSEVTRGTLNADMEIPPDTYALPSLNLQFISMKGRVQFNLPLKQKDNNLVETFEVDSIRWKEIKTGKAFLSVTYDSAGIYAKFGAEAYEGYINGQMNVYTDDSFHWDGWLGAKNLQSHDLTRILCPGYFLMKGKVEVTLVAQGSKDELYQADGSFKNHTPGKFTISALDGVIKDLPKDWEPLKAQITKIGLETMRDFEYDRAEMTCRFYGREGNGRFSFSGPHGSRNFDVNVYDHRWKTDDEVEVIATRTEPDALTPANNE